MNFWKTIRLLLLILSVTAFVSCRTSKQSVVSDDKVLYDNLVDKMVTGTLKSGTVSAKLNLKIDMNGKSASVGGSCNLKRNEVIQLSLVALGFMEVGRLEVTPEYFLLIDRMNRQYVRLSYQDSPELQKLGLDFYTLQALFWNDLMVPGKGNAWQEGDFDIVSSNDSETVLRTNSMSLLQGQFVVDRLTGLIRNTTIAVNSSVSLPPLGWTYMHFADVGGKSFPDRMQLSLKSGAKNYNALFMFDNIRQNDKDINLTSEPNSRYKKVDIETILKKLSEL